MKNKKYVLSTTLIAVVGVAMIACVLLRMFLPAIILPQLSIPNMVALSLIALYLDHCFTKETKRCWICVVLFSALTFGLLPYAASFVGVWDALKLAGVGCGVFTVTTWLYTSILNRIVSGPVAKAAPLLSALGLYLASQCFAGVF